MCVDLCDFLILKSCKIFCYKFYSEFLVFFDGVVCVVVNCCWIGIFFYKLGMCNVL